MSLTPELITVSQADMDELKQALALSNVSQRAFCDFLSEELAEVGHEDESHPEKFRGWFKKGRLPPRQLLEDMWRVLRMHPDFIASEQIKPVYISTGGVDPKLENAMRQLSKRISDKLIK